MAAFIWEPLTSRNRYSDPEGSKSLQHPRLFSHTRRNGWHRVKGSGAGTEKGLANDLAAINRVAEPGIAVDAYRHIAEQRRFFFLPFSPSPSLSPFTLHPPSRSIPINLRSVFIAINALSLSPFLVLPGGNEKRALWTGPMVLDERYPLPARRTKLRSHRKRRNIVIAATIPSPLHPPRLCRDIYRRRTESFRRTTGKRPLFNRLQHAWFLVISGFSLFSPIPVPDLRWRVQSASRFPSLFFSFSFSFLFFFFEKGYRAERRYDVLLITCPKIRNRERNYNVSFFPKLTFHGIFT